MSWIAKLSKTYDYAFGRAEYDESKTPLLPLSHTTVQAQISITVDLDGNFKHAYVIPKESATTIIPCTESSGNRTSGKSPHPLCDTLEYVAGDLLEYYEVKEKASDNIRKSHQEYLDLLSSWCDSPFGDDRLSAVLKYVRSGTLCSDLSEEGILRLDDEDKLIIKWDEEEMGAKPKFYSVIAGNPVKSFVRWAIYTPEGDEDLSSSKIWNLWEKFTDSNTGEEDICMVSGKKTKITTLHPSKIRNPGDKAKLISSNDSSGFTYRGRFTNGREACTVGYSTSHKAHNALRWLINKQGYRQGDWCVVSWQVSTGETAINPAEDPVNIFFSELESEEEDSAYTDKVSSEKINNMIKGIHGEIDEEGVVTMVLDSVNKGRLAIVYYREFSGSEFEENLNYWYSSCLWPRRYKGANGKWMTTVFPPSLRDIVKCAYGWNVDGNLLKSALNRLTPCVVECAPVPIDITQSVFNNACKPMSYEWYEWESMLSLACALYKKEKIKEKYEMVLEKDRRTRDYLFGRLLAVADVMENYALYKAGEKRETNAMRNMQQFADRPTSTWRHLNLALAPYRSRLPNNGSYYDKIISDIMDLFDTEDFISNKRLSGEFLLGFYTQRSDLRKKRENVEETENQEE